MICPDCSSVLKDKALRCKCGWKAVNAVQVNRDTLHRCPNHPDRVGGISPVIYTGAGPHPGPFYCTECGRGAAEAALAQSPIGARALTDIKAILGKTANREPGEDEQEASGWPD